MDDLLTRGEPDRLGYATQTTLLVPQGVDEQGMKFGDKGWYQSYRDIWSDQVWQGENVIKLQDGNYWAFPFSGKMGISMEEIKLKLRQGYREVKGREPTGEMAGMQHFVDFFDVPGIAMQIFKFRGGKE